MRLARQGRLAMMRRDDRGHSRHPVLWSAMVCAEGKYERYVLNGKIRNISITGVQVLVDKTIDPGCKVTLRIDRVGTFSGRVAWCDDGRIGIRFDPAAKRVVELVLPRLGEPAPPWDQD
jgi:hypothetical protein